MSKPTEPNIAAFITARLDEWQMHAEKDLWCAGRASEGGRWEAHYGYNLTYSELWAAGETTGESIARFTAMPPWPDGRPDGAEDQHQKDVSLAARMASGARPRAEQRLREAAAMRAILAEILAIPHRNVEDCWYSCSQAADPGEEPGSACCDDDRRGNPCDCGRDQKVARMAGMLASIWADHPAYKESWRP